MSYKITIYGGGAVGCTLAAHLHNTPNIKLTLIARGVQFNTVKSNGVHYTDKSGSQHYAIDVKENIDTIPEQDLVFLTTKSYQLPSIAKHIGAILHKNTTVIPVCNGIPWWLLQGLKVREKFDLRSATLPLLDPQQELERQIPLKHIIGGVVYMGATITSPGNITNHAGPFLQIGTPTNNHQHHIDKIEPLLSSSNLKYSISNDIYINIFNKLCWNIAFNCFSVIHTMDSQTMAEDENICMKSIQIMKEIETIAQSYGIKLTVDADKHILTAKNAGHHKPSMLQDYESNKKLETDAILLTPQYLGHQNQCKIPHIDHLTSLFNTL